MPDTFLQAFRRRVAGDPEATAWVHVSARSGEVRTTRAEALGRAEARAAALAGRGVTPGDVVLVAVEEGREQASLFLGALAAGALPCIFPALVPGMDPEGHAARLAEAAARVRARLVVVDDGDRTPLPDGHRVARSTLVREGDGARTEGTAAPVSQGDVAFLQLSSGTTGRQKVVPVTHVMLLGMAEARAAAFEVGPDDVAVGWVPLYHDLGLVGGLLAPLVQGIPSVLLSPVEWLAEPSSLMRAVHRHRGTLCSMPNFAFHYCARRIHDDQMDGVRLDSWRVLANGAEPVRPEAFAVFAERFSPWGFRPSAFAAGYGLAEHTLTATLTPLGTAPRVDRVGGRLLREEDRAEPVSAASNGDTEAEDAQGDDAAVLVSCGVPLAGVEVRIASADGTALPERHVGGILLRSPYVFPGYRDDPERTADTLRDGWLVTGDLGYLADGQLYVCGRSNDVIILGGANLQAEDVEAAAGRARGAKPGRVAAFGVADPETGSEILVVVAERADGSDAFEVEQAVRRSVRREMGVAPAVVDIVPPGWIVKTTSGKLARAATRDRWRARQGERPSPEGRTP